MSGHFEDEVSVPSFVDQLSRKRTPDREPTKHERPRAEGESLCPEFALVPDHLDLVQLSQSTLRDQQLWARL
jgi:hypothetical protein